ncbi:hypothetical protein Tco_0247109 [Tanacetum coccineum]
MAAIFSLVYSAGNTSFKYSTLRNQYRSLIPDQHRSVAIPTREAYARICILLNPSWDVDIKHVRSVDLETRTIKFKIGGIECASCSISIESVLQELNGVESVVSILDIRLKVLSLLILLVLCKRAAGLAQLLPEKVVVGGVFGVGLVEGWGCCWRDDLFIFAHGEVDSVGMIMASLDEFRKVLGLVPSIQKSMAYFCNVLNHVKMAILNIMPFSKGGLPINYLGVPLISSLIASMQVFWASVLVIPMGIVYDIQQLIRGFLWCNGEYKRRKAKVSWVNICLSKKEGGLSLRSLEGFNLALMTTHIWNIVSNKESLWVRWINTYKLRGRTLWDAQPSANMSYGWRKLLQLREHVKPFFWSCIGNGMNTFLWYDMWSSHCPLSRFMTPRDIAWEGYSIQTRVADLLLLMRRSLKTQDKLRQWDVAPTTDITQVRCSLCGMQPDSHEHLFFQCSYSSKVWTLILGLVGMDVVPPILDNILAWF